MRAGAQANDLRPEIDQAIIVITGNVIQRDMDRHKLAPDRMIASLKARREPACKSLFFNKTISWHAPDESLMTGGARQFGASTDDPALAIGLTRV
jgi:hypothetical protein